MPCQRRDCRPETTSFCFCVVIARRWTKYNLCLLELELVVRTRSRWTGPAHWWLYTRTFASSTDVATYVRIPSSLWYLHLMRSTVSFILVRYYQCKDGAQCMAEPLLGFDRSAKAASDGSAIPKPHPGHRSRRAERTWHLLGRLTLRTPPRLQGITDRDVFSPMSRSSGLHRSLVLQAMCACW